MTKSTIFFADALQAALFDNELTGQISDGCWENSKPHDHWIRPCKAEVAIDAQNPRVEIVGHEYFKRSYNFANPMLIDVVGDRMKNIVMLAKAGYSKEIISTFDDIYDSMFYDTTPYWMQKRALFTQTFGTKEEYDRIVNTDRISTQALRKMLQEMSKIVNSGSMRNRFKL